MAGDASTRSYARLFRDEAGVILMNSPRRPDGPPIHDGKSYSAAAHLAEDVKPFVAIAGGLRERGFSAPAIHYADLDAGFLITEDFGSVCVVEGDPPRPIGERYQAATDMLAALHRLPLPATLPLTPHTSYTIPLFDTDALLVEIGLMLDWYLPERNATPADAGTCRVGDDVARAARQSRRRPEDTSDADLGVTRFPFAQPDLARQSGGYRKDRNHRLSGHRAGPAAYDLVSLLQDARVDVPEQLELVLLTRYIKARLASDGNFDPAHFAELYAVMSAQRNTKLLGIFARLNRRDGKPQYLRHLPRIWTYLTRSLTHPALASLRQWYAANVPSPSP